MINTQNLLGDQQYVVMGLITALNSLGDQRYVVIPLINGLNLLGDQRTRLYTLRQMINCDTKTGFFLLVL